MFFRTLLTASLLGSLLPLACKAQNTLDAPRFYVGIGANMLSKVPFTNQGTATRLIGPAVMAGWQFTPRLAGQIGLSYHWKKDAYSYQTVDQTGYSISTYTYRSNYFTVPVLLRYTVTNPAERFHFDILGGATITHARGSSLVEYYSSTGTNLTPKESSYSDTQFNLTLGPAVRYALLPYLELTATGLVSAVMGENYYRFSDRLFLNTAVGVNYTFGKG